MQDGFEQSYYCLRLFTEGGELMDFTTMPGEVCRMIHLGSMKRMGLISQDTRRLNLTKMFPKGQRVQLAQIDYLIAVNVPELRRVLKQEFYHPFKTPTFIKDGKLYATQKNLIRKQELYDLFPARKHKYKFPKGALCSQFIS